MKILEKLIHSIVPHHKNNNVPHFLQGKFVAVTAFLVVLLFAFNQNNFTLIRGLNLTGAIYPAVLADMNNEERAEQGFAKLAWSPTLENAARLKAEDMIANSYFAHESPTGISPWFWLSRVNYDFIYAGENLAIDFTESADVHRAWVDSPTHRANLLGANFTEIGISAIDGNFNGRNTTFVVQYFGKPLKAKTTEARTVNNVVPTQSTEPSSPEVAGASASKTPSTPPAPKIQVTIIAEEESSEEKLIVAQNTDVEETATQVNTSSGSTENMSKWYMRLAVDPSHVIKIVYSTIIALATLAVVLILSKEYQKHHMKHLVLGLALIAFTGALFYLLNAPSVLIIALQA